MPTRADWSAVDDGHISFVVALGGVAAGTGIAVLAVNVLS
jgi:hypothetical protein